MEGTHRQGLGRGVALPGPATGTAPCQHLRACSQPGSSPNPLPLGVVMGLIPCAGTWTNTLMDTSFHSHD